MANISVRKETSPTAQTQQPTPEWEPFRWMRTMMGWDPFRELAPLSFEDKASFAPAFEIKETKEGYLFKADVPGVSESDIEVNLTGNRLNVSGKRDAEKREQGDKYYTYERSYGSFLRSFTLPEGVDANDVHAAMKDGVLTISIGKKLEAQPKKIAVKSANGPKS